MWKSTAKGRIRWRAVAWALAFVALLLATAYGAYAYGRSQSPAVLGEKDRQSLALYADALDTVRDDYVDQEAIDPVTSPACVFPSTQKAGLSAAGPLSALVSSMSQISRPS